MPVNPMPKPAPPAVRAKAVFASYRQVVAVLIGVFAGALAAGDFSLVGAVLAAAAVAIATR